MSLQALRDALPPYAADLRDNLDVLADDRELSAEERWGCFVACACAAGEPTTLRELLDGASEVLGARGIEAAKAAAAVTAMNNIYYGALGGLTNGEYANMRSRLRMDGLAHPGADKPVFELWCLSVSALNSCGPCMDAQDEELRRRAVSPVRIQTALRIAAVTGATARVLAAEAAAGGDDQEGDADADFRREDDARGAPPAPSTPDLVKTPHPAPAPGDVAPD